jgi:hypothetical protein
MQVWYYYNAQGDRSWDPPPGWVAATDDGHDGATRPAAAAAPPGYYYVDAYGTTQGPFSREQLEAWRGALPMDLPVWLQPAPPSSPAAEAAGQAAAGDLQEGEHPAESEHKEPPPPSPPGRHPPQAPPPVAPSPEAAAPLAHVLGDAALLARWRVEHPHLASTSCAAPPAPAYQASAAQEPLGTAAAADAADDDPLLLGLGGDSFTSLAEAALAGLPPDDDAVALARLAAAAGRPVGEVAVWARRAGGAAAAAGDYTSTVLHSAGRGRVQAAGAGGGPGSLYAEMGSWADPAGMEAQLAAAAARKRRPLGAAEVRAVRARKQEMRDKKQRAWLLD